MFLAVTTVVMGVVLVTMENDTIGLPETVKVKALVDKDVLVPMVMVVPLGLEESSSPRAVPLVAYLAIQGEPARRLAKLAQRTHDVGEDKIPELTGTELDVYVTNVGVEGRKTDTEGPSGGNTCPVDRLSDAEGVSVANVGVEEGSVGNSDVSPVDL